METWLPIVSWCAVFVVVLSALSAMLVRWRTLILGGLCFVLPILKIGPFDPRFADWKLALVLGLLFAFPPPRYASGGLAGERARFLAILAVALMLVSTTLSATPHLAVHVVQNHLTASLFFLLLCRYFDWRVWQVSVAAIVSLTLAACGTVFLQYAVLRFRWEHLDLVGLLPPEMIDAYFYQRQPVPVADLRLPSFFLHANHLGHFLGIAFGVLLPLVLAARRSRDRAIILVAIGLMGPALALTQSRAAAGIIAAQLLALLAIEWRYLRKHARKIALAVLFPILLSIPAGSNLTAFASRMFSAGLAHRISNWSYSVQLLPDHWLFGVGPGCASFWIMRGFPPVDPESRLHSYDAQLGLDLWSTSTHNYYLGTLLETGIFSLVVQLLLYGSLLVMAARMLRRIRDRRMRMLTLSAALPLGAEFVRGITDDFDFLTAMDTGPVIALLMAQIVFLTTQTTESPGSVPLDRYARN